MNWSDPEHVKIYRAGFMRGYRLMADVKIGASPMAVQVMINEAVRYRRSKCVAVRKERLRKKIETWERRNAA